MANGADSVRRPAVLVSIPAGRAPAETLIGAIDAALASALPGLAVRVELADGDPRTGPVTALCEADPRVVVVAPGTPAPEAEVVVELPARARPEPRTLPAIVELVRAEELASVAVRIPGVRRGAVRARAGGAGSRRLRAAAVGLRAAGGRRAPGPSPQGTLPEERARHLRHRARSATLRARADRQAHRYARERLQVRHERARRRLAEERLGRSGPGEWLRWRARSVARRVAGIPAVAAGIGRQGLASGRRARRFALDRWRSRGSEA